MSKWSYNIRLFNVQYVLQKYFVTFLLLNMKGNQLLQRNHKANLNMLSLVNFELLTLKVSLFDRHQKPLYSFHFQRLLMNSQKKKEFQENMFTIVDAFWIFEFKERQFMGLQYKSGINNMNQNTHIRKLIGKLIATCHSIHLFPISPTVARVSQKWTNFPFFASHRCSIEPK